MASDSQKFIARNRAPRVQIEYDVELYGAEKKVQLPFVMGVMADLAGKSSVPQPAIEDRKFLDIDVDSFDDRMRAMAPRASFAVPNALTGEGNLSVDLTFASMKDFSPAAVAAKVEPLRALLEARTQLQNLLTYMDGKAGAEALIEKVLGDPALLAALSAAPAPVDAAADATLAGLAATASEVEARPDTMGDVLAGLRASAPEERPEVDAAADILAGVTASAAEDAEAPDTTGDVLAGLRDAAPTDEPEADTSGDVLSELAAEAPADPKASDKVGDVLAGLRGAMPNEEPEQDGSDDILAGLTAAPVAEEAGEEADDILSGLLDGAESAEPETDGSDDILAGLAAASVAEEIDEKADDILAGLLDEAETAEPESDGSDDILAGLAAAPVAEAAGEADDDILSGLLDGVETAEPETDGSDDILADLVAGPVAEETDEEADDILTGLVDVPLTERAGDEEIDLDSLLAGDDGGNAGVADGLDALLAEDAGASGEDALSDLDDLLGGGSEGDAAKAVPDDLDALLAGDDGGNGGVANDLNALLAEDAGAGGEDALSDLDDLLGGGSEGDAAKAVSDDLDALLAGDDGGNAGVADDLDALLAGDEAGAAEQSSPSVDGGAGARQVETPYGFVSAPRPDPETLRRTGFRMAFFGDFTGRAARGLIEPGEGLANRRAIALDVDTVEDVIAGFATDLVLPLGPEGRGIAVQLKDLDALHPDELFDNVEIFQGLSGLRQRLKSASLAPAAMAELQKWGAAHGQPLTPPRRTSAGSSVPANLRLGAFQALIGDTDGRLTQAAPVDDMIARIIGPHVVEAPNPDTQAMQGAVDAALSSAMRMILHHPEFQSVEALWRSLDFLARRIETDVKLTIDLFDVSAEELAVDLAAQDNMAESGLLRLLTDRPLGDEGPGGYSALFGLYTFEETPPHAELLARIAHVAAHVDAPFFTAISPAFLETAKEDRHPLVAAAWDGLRALPEAQYLGLSSPRFLLRHPYGERSDPIDAFDFEEFTPEEGLSGMLWANPVLLVAVLLATGWKQHGKAMSLGSVMGIGDIPYHFVTDQHGDQVALPCTERNLTTSKVERVVTRGFQPVLSIRGRNEIRLGSFQSLGGTEIRGRWSGTPMPPREPPPGLPKQDTRPADIEMDLPIPPPDATPATDAGGADDLDALLAGLDAPSADAGGLDDLDALLAGFDDSASAPSGAGEMDDELAKLLEGL